MCKITPKIVLGILGIIFWAVAGGLMFIGSWIYKEYHNYEHIAEAKFTLVPATILMAGAIFLFLLGIIGCVGAFKEQRCLLGLFFTILFVIFAGLISVAVISAVYSDMISDSVEKGLNNGLQDYGNNTAVTQDIDFLQQNLKCCGVHNYTEWQATPWYKNSKNTTVKYPASCCKDKQCQWMAKNDTNLYTEGCYSLLDSQFKGHLNIILAVGAGLAVIQLLGMICSCVLIWRRKAEVPYIGLSEPNGLRV